MVYVKTIAIFAAESEMVLAILRIRGADYRKVTSEKDEGRLRFPFTISTLSSSSGTFLLFSKQVRAKNLADCKVEVDRPLFRVLLVQALKFFVELMAVKLVLKIFDLLIVKIDCVVVFALNIKKPGVAVVVEVNLLHGPHRIVEVEHLEPHQFVVPILVLKGEDFLVVEPIAIMRGIRPNLNLFFAEDNLLRKLPTHYQVEALDWFRSRAIRVVFKELLSRRLEHFGVVESGLQVPVLFKGHWGTIIGLHINHSAMVVDGREITTGAVVEVAPKKPVVLANPSAKHSDYSAFHECELGGVDAPGDHLGKDLGAVAEGLNRRQEDIAELRFGVGHIAPRPDGEDAVVGEVDFLTIAHTHEGVAVLDAD